MFKLIAAVALLVGFGITMAWITFLGWALWEVAQLF